MSADSYTYTTITAGPDEPTRIGVSFHLDGRASVGVSGAGTDRPFLSVMHGEVWVRICPRTEDITAADAAIARNLASEAVLYAAEVERLAQESAESTAA